MANIYEYRDYRKFLSDVLKSNSARRGIQSSMARHIGCQASYLYQILKGKADLTDDQAYKVTTFLKFSGPERELFFCLVRRAKASTPELQKFLSNDIERRVTEHLDLKARVGASLPPDNGFWDYYFFTCVPSFIHILTSSKNFQTTKALAQKLSLSEETILYHLKRLNEHKLVDYRDMKWVYACSSIHFEKESRHNHQMQINRRLQSLAFLNQHSAGEDSVHFSTLFTLDPKSLQKLKMILADFVEKAQQTIHDGGTDDAFVLNLDLFNI